MPYNKLKSAWIINGDGMKILLWEIRTSKGLTLMELEKITGVKKSTLNNIENEKTSPNLNQLEAIAKGLNVRISHLFESEYK
jgi:Predicted transcriptional regulators